MYMIALIQKTFSAHQKLFFVFFLASLLFPLTAFSLDVLGQVLTTSTGFFREIFAALYSASKDIFFLIIKFTILDFADYWNGSVGVGLKALWQMVRDIVNLLIVILFIVTAFFSVFGDFFFKRKLLFGLLIAAVLVNFSAFFTLVLFDISHAFFAIAFNMLDTHTLTSASYSAYGIKLQSLTDSGTWNALYNMMFAVGYLFLAIGFLYLSAILIERFIVAILLVVSSPLAILGLFASKGMPLGVIGELFNIWKNRLFSALLNPVVMIFGLAFITVLYASISNQMPDPNSLADLQGPKAHGILAQLSLATLLLVIGVFKIGQIVSNIRIGRFAVGKYLKSAITLNNGRALLGAARNIARPVRERFTRGESGLGRTARNTREYGRGIGLGTRDVWSGRNVEPGRFDAVRNRRATEQETGRIVREGTFEERVGAARRSSLSGKQFKQFFTDKGLHESLAGNNGVTDAQLRRLINTQDVTEDTLLTAIKNPNISTGTLQNIIEQNPSDSVRAAATAAVHKKNTGQDAPRLSNDEKRRIIARAIGEAGVPMDEATLRRYARNTDESVGVRMDIAGMTKEIPDGVFTDLLKGSNTRIIRTLIDRPDITPARLKSILADSELTNREVRRHAERKLEELLGNT